MVDELGELSLVGALRAPTRDNRLQRSSDPPPPQGWVEDDVALTMEKNMSVRSFLKSTGTAMEFGSHLHTAADVISRLRGVEPSKDSKGWAGIFGHRDEIYIQNILTLLRAKENGDKKTVVLRNFLNKLNSGEKYQEKLLAMWYMSAFRVYLTKMVDETPKAENGNPVYDNAVDFLDYIATIIIEADTEEEGHKEVLEHFRASGVPYMKPETLNDWIKWATALGVRSHRELMKWYEELDEALEAEMARIREEQARESGPKRFFRNLVG